MKYRVANVDQADRMYLRMERAITNGPVWVEMTPYKPLKTLLQLEKIHAVIRDFSIHNGTDVDDMKVRLKDHLGYWKPVERADGSVIRKYLSFRDASKEQMSEMIDNLTALADEYGVKLNEPQHE